MLLSNISRSTAIAARLVRLQIPVYFAPWTYPPFSRSATSTAPTSEQLSGQKTTELAALSLLLDAFVAGATPNAREGSLHFLASVFANISLVRVRAFVVSMLGFIPNQIPEGRLFFFTPSSSNPASAQEHPLAKVVPFTEHPDTIRRGGAASTIKFVPPCSSCSFVSSLTGTAVSSRRHTRRFSFRPTFP
jgi:hypothetical protein